MKQDDPEWFARAEEWNNAVDMCPRMPKPQTYTGYTNRPVLLHIMKLSEAELDDILLGSVPPPPRVMRVVRMLNSGHGRTWLKLWLRDFENIQDLRWPDGTPVTVHE